MACAYRALKAAVCLLILAASASSFAKVNPTGRDLDLSVQLYINQVQRAVVDITITPEDHFVIDKSLLDEYLYPRLNSDAQSAYIDWVNTPKIDLAELQPHGIAHRFDMSDFSLHLVLEPRLVGRQRVSLVNERRALQALPVAKTSAYLNHFLNAVNQDNPFTDSEQTYTWRSEMVARKYDWVFESNQQWQKDEREENFERIATRLSYDLPDSDARFTVGDQYVRGGDFQGALNSLGLGYVKDSGVITRRRQAAGAQYSFTLTRPSEVEIFSEGRLLRRVPLQPGLYNLADIPLQEGANDIELRITDDAGEVTTISLGVNSALDLLAPQELRLYSYLGVPSDRGDNQPDYAWQQKFLSIHAEYGLSLESTLAAGAQLSEHLKQLSSQWAYASDWGVWQVGAAVSDDETFGLGYSGEFIFQSYRRTVGSEFELNYRWSDEDFRVLYLQSLQLPSSPFSRHAWRANYRYGFESGAILAVSGATIKPHNNERWSNSVRVSFSDTLVSWPINWRVFAQWREEEDKEYNFGLQLTYRFDNERRLRVLTERRDHHDNIEYSQQRNSQFIGMNQLRASYDNTEDEQAALDLFANYNGNRFEGSITHGSSYETLDARTARHRTQLSLQQSWAYADNQWAVGRPIDDAFAIVVPHASLKDKRLLSSNRDGDVRARNSSWSKAVVLSDLSAYTNSIIDIEVEDLPLGYNVNGSLVFSPLHRSGHSITLGSAENITLIGTLYQDKDTPLALTSLAARCPDNDKSYRFFTNRKGRFALTNIAACVYQVSLDGSEQVLLELVVEDGQQLQRRGVIYVQP